MSFKEKVFKIVKLIPEGEVKTYKEVAILAGNPKAMRAVGAVLHTNYNPEIPCHRVVYTNGQLGGYNRGEKLKKKKLEDEGVIMK